MGIAPKPSVSKVSGEASDSLDGSNMKAIATLSMNPTIDKTATHDCVAEYKLRCHCSRYEAGDGGIHVSRAIRRLGGESIALDTSGGPAGEMLQALLDAKASGTIRVKDWTRENVIVLEEITGQQYRFGMPGLMLSEDQYQRALGEFPGLDATPRLPRHQRQPANQRAR
jgi:6-phosphofructokinase 2